jgi:Fic family protein
MHPQKYPQKLWYNTSKKESVLDFTPLLPRDNQGNIDARLLSMAEELCIQSAMLTGSHAPHVLHEIKELLRKVNSYYSNQIESEGTHPIDIDRATRQEFSNDSREKRLQQLSLVHIQVQRHIENDLVHAQSPCSRGFILDVHRALYAHPDMVSFLEIADKDGQKTITMVPGQLRKDHVRVGQHIAPSPDDLPHFLDQYEHLYALSDRATKAHQVISALSSHHRLMWIHPFLDGNGRTARLVLDGVFYHMGLEGYGLWNISRGLSRRTDEYRHYLALADRTRQGDLDGRGALSTRALAEYVAFMLEVALDQVAFMGQNLKMDSLHKRIESYVRLSREGLLGIEPLPKYSESLFRELLMAGEVQRGKVMEIIGTKERSATALIKELTQRDFLISDTPKSPVRLRFNAHFASHIFPELIPQR